MFVPFRMYLNCVYVVYYEFCSESCLLCRVSSLPCWRSFLRTKSRKLETLASKRSLSCPLRGLCLLLFTIRLLSGAYYFPSLPVHSLIVSNLVSVCVRILWNSHSRNTRSGGQSDTLSWCLSQLPTYCWNSLPLTFRRQFWFLSFICKFNFFLSFFFFYHSWMIGTSQASVTRWGDALYFLGLSLALQVIILPSVSEPPCQQLLVASHRCLKDTVKHSSFLSVFTPHLLLWNASPSVTRQSQKPGSHEPPWPRFCSSVPFSQPPIYTD